MIYKHLNYLQRCKIQALWRSVYTQQQIDDEICVNKSTISRAPNRNMTFVRTRLWYWAYKADYTQFNSDNRKKCKNKYVKFTEEIKVFVREKLKTIGVPIIYVDMQKRILFRIEARVVIYISIVNAMGVLVEVVLSKIEDLLIKGQR
ncbi:Transposase and inactivated derivatives, IS30 family [Legionella bozemanae]|uniref:Uncharacterized protein n=1 Tax=Legionella bozemanae TaxID=447 RepID=A0A0W0R6S2_LEGBO|nr:helix-turn-helix domain containing protein [Legionella bozemanae]KTC66734.1 hypothetical protein Lboz_3629 [Legionella bozemanae]STO34644.1 Transposase and inactivated derivatives, IS30 family [Legionella bozemanae]